MWSTGNLYTNFAVSLLITLRALSIYQQLFFKLIYLVSNSLVFIGRGVTNYHSEPNDLHNLLRSRSNQGELTENFPFAPIYSDDNFPRAVKCCMVMWPDESELMNIHSAECCMDQENLASPGISSRYSSGIYPREMRGFNVHKHRHRRGKIIRTTRYRVCFQSVFSTEPANEYHRQYFNGTNRKLL